MCAPSDTIQLLHAPTYLLRWAARFTSDESLQVYLVETTISEILREFPVADDSSSIEIELLATMRRALLRKFDARWVVTPPRSLGDKFSTPNNGQ